MSDKEPIICRQWIRVLWPDVVAAVEPAIRADERRRVELEIADWLEILGERDALVEAVRDSRYPQSVEESDEVE